MKHLQRGLLAVLALLPLACTAQTPETYQLGQHYKPVREEAAPSDPAKVDVVEVFWYGCPHCYQIEPFVQSWLGTKAADVNFFRIPASLGRPSGIAHSKAFYAAESLGVSDRIHVPLFEAIHKNRDMTDTPEKLRAFFISKAGVKGEDFDAAFTGFMIDSRVRKAEQSLRDFGITSVPAVIVGGRFVTNASMAGGPDQVFKVVDFLTAKIRAERKKP